MYSDRVERKGRGRGGRPTPYSRGDDDAEEADPCKVFVGNLSYDTTWKELKDHMASAGDVAYADVMQGPDGRSRGTGLVRFNSEDDAANAIETLTESELDGRTIFVRADRGGRGGGGGGGGSKGSKGGRGRGGSKGSKGSKGGGKGRGSGRKMSASDLDADLDSYMGGSGAPPEAKAKVAGNLDDDLDAYFAAGSKKKGKAAEEDAAAD